MYHSHTHSRQPALPRWAAAGALFLLTALPAFSQSATVYDFAQSPTSLSESLEKFSTTTGLDIAARSGGLKGKSAPALQGKLTAEQALDRLLAGTGLQHRFTGPATVAIVEPQGEGDMNSETLAPVVVTAEAPSYTVNNATTATRLDTPLRDVPQSINVIPRQVIEDRGVIRAAEIADNAPGVRPQSGYGGVSSGGFFIRGFNSATYLDGLRKETFLSPLEVQGVERVEFLKGPASVLYGQNQPGGIVNFVSKRPIAERLAEVGFTYGSYDLYRATGDFGGTLLSRSVPGTPAPAPASEKNPKNPNPKAPVLPGSEPVLTYRLVGAYENAGSHRDFNESESYYIAPSLTWAISPETSLTIYGEYQRYDYVFDRGLLPVPQTFLVPTSRFIGDPENYAKTDAWRAGYEFTHSFSDDVKFRSAFAALQTDQRSLFSQPADLDTDGRTVLRGDTRRHERSTDYTLQNELNVRFNTGAVEHNTLLGVELTYAKFEYDLAFGAESTIDLFRPVYNHMLDTNIPHVPWEGTQNQALGVYFQDQITITEQLKLLVGIRYDYVESKENYSTVFKHTDEAFSPRIGIVYQPWEPLSIYAGWSRSFSPNFGASQSGGGFDPEEGEQFEAGLKVDIVRDVLTSTLAFYDITKSNVLATDPTDPNFSILTGEQKSRGIEYDLMGVVAPGWNIIASYAYTDAYVSEDTSITEGSRLPGVPEHQAGLWTSYEIQDGTLKGFGVGTGIYYVSERVATLPNNGVNLPAYWRWDASVFYRRDNWSAQVNFKNITDEDIYQSQGYLIVPDAGFNVQASITYRF